MDICSFEEKWRELKKKRGCVTNESASIPEEEKKDGLVFWP